MPLCHSLFSDVAGREEGRAVEYTQSLLLTHAGINTAVYALGVGEEGGERVHTHTDLSSSNQLSSRLHIQLKVIEVQ